MKIVFLFLNVLSPFPNILEVQHSRESSNSEMLKDSFESSRIFMVVYHK